MDPSQHTVTVEDEAQALAQRIRGTSGGERPYNLGVLNSELLTLERNMANGYTGWGFRIAVLKRTLEFFGSGGLVATLFMNENHPSFIMAEQSPGPGWTPARRTDAHRRQQGATTASLPALILGVATELARSEELRRKCSPRASRRPSRASATW